MARRAGPVWALAAGVRVVRLLGIWKCIEQALTRAADVVGRVGLERVGRLDHGLCPVAAAGVRRDSSDRIDGESAECPGSLKRRLVTVRYAAANRP